MVNKMLENEKKSRRGIICADCGETMIYNDAAEMFYCVRCTDDNRWKITKKEEK